MIQQARQFLVAFHKIGGWMDGWMVYGAPLPTNQPPW